MRPGDKILLVGAGGHAKGLVEIITARGAELIGHTGPEPSDWLQAPYLGEDEAITPDQGGIVLGFGAVTTAALAKRLEKLETLADAGFALPPVVSPHAIISPSAEIGDGTHILPGALLHAASSLGQGAIVNSRAIIEHDCQIGPGSHIAPGAIILGGCKIGRACMIGAGAVILPGMEIPDETLIAANSRFGA